MTPETSASAAVSPPHEIDDREPESGRHAVRFPGHGEVAGLGLHHVVEARPGGALVVAAVGREVHTDEARVDGAEAGIVEPERARQIAAQIVDESVRAPSQALQDLAAARFLQVQRQAALVAAEGLVEEAVAVFGVGQDMAAHLAAGLVVLDLDDVGAEVGEVHGAEGGGAILFDGDDGEPFERPDRGCRPRRGSVVAHAGLRSIS